MLVFGKMDSHDHSHDHGHDHGECSKDCDQAHDHNHSHHRNHGNDHHKHEESCTKDCDQAHDHSHDHDNGGHSGSAEPPPAKKLKRVHKHDSAVSSVGILEDGEVNMEMLNEWIGTLLQEKGAGIYRMKGILAVHGSAEKFVFQGVHMQFDGEPFETWKDGEKRVNKLVFIGKHLNKEELLAAFRACLVKKEA